MPLARLHDVMRMLAAMVALSLVGCVPGELLGEARHRLHGYKHVSMVSKDDFGTHVVYAFENSRTGAFVVFVCPKGHPFSTCAAYGASE